MSHTITIRLTPEIAAWLERTTDDTGLPQGRIVREELARAMAKSPQRRVMHLAGSIDGPGDLSTRKGFSQPMTKKPRNRPRP